MRFNCSSFNLCNVLHFDGWRFRSQTFISRPYFELLATRLCFLHLQLASSAYKYYLWAFPALVVTCDMNIEVD